jgi:hypothetical protein
LLPITLANFADYSEEVGFMEKANISYQSHPEMTLHRVFTLRENTLVL